MISTRKFTAFALFALISFFVGLGSSFAAFPRQDLAGNIRPAGSITMGALEPGSGNSAVPTPPTGLRLFIN